MYNIAIQKKVQHEPESKNGGYFVLFMKTKEIEMVEANCSFGFFLLFKIELDSNPPFFIFDRKKSFSTSECKV